MDNFLASDSWQQSCSLLVEKLLQNTITQNKVDEIYDNFCRDLFTEIDNLWNIKV